MGLWDDQEYGWKRKSQAHAEHFPNMLGEDILLSTTQSPILQKTEHTVGVQQVYTNSLTLKWLNAERN